MRHTKLLQPIHEKCHARQVRTCKVICTTVTVNDNNVYEHCITRSNTVPIDYESSEPVFNLADPDDRYRLRLRQNDRYCSDDILKFIFANGSTWVLIQISMKFVPKSPVNNKPALVLVMAWRQTGELAQTEIEMVQRLGLLSQFPPFRYYPNFSVSPKHRLIIEHRTHIYIYIIYYIYIYVYIYIYHLPILYCTLTSFGNNRRMISVMTWCTQNM